MALRSRRRRRTSCAHDVSLRELSTSAAAASLARKRRHDSLRRHVPKDAACARRRFTDSVDGPLQPRYAENRTSAHRPRRRERWCGLRHAGPRTSTISSASTTASAMPRAIAVLARGERRKLRETMRPQRSSWARHRRERNSCIRPARPRTRGRPLHWWAERLCALIEETRFLQFPVAAKPGASDRLSIGVAARGTRRGGRISKAFVSRRTPPYYAAKSGRGRKHGFSLSAA